MKAFRGQPSIFASVRPDEKRAELEVRNLTLRFGGITALNKIDLTVSSGELVAIIGPNGAGKTSLTGRKLPVFILINSPGSESAGPIRT